MGFFSSSKPPLPKSTNKVWKTEQACLKGIVTESLLSIKQSQLPVILTFFDDAHTKLLSFMDVSKVPYQCVEAFAGKDVWLQKNIIFVVHAFSAGNFSDNIPSSAPVNFFCLGRYPLLGIENSLMGKLNTRFPKAPVIFCLSLDDSLFESLGAQNLKPLMETLGLGDEEAIEHTMVNKALHNALEKIGQKVNTETKTVSEKEWFRRNLPA
jgi:hypothetical protein